MLTIFGWAMINVCFGQCVPLCFGCLRLTIIDRYRKACRLVLALVLLLFTMGLDNVEAAYASVFSESQITMGEVNAKNTVVKFDSIDHLQANFQCMRHEWPLKITTESDGHNRSGHINSCELQISVNEKAEMLFPLTSEIGWWKIIMHMLDPIDSAIAPKPPRNPLF